MKRHYRRLLVVGAIALIGLAGCKKSDKANSEMGSSTEATTQTETSTEKKPLPNEKWSEVLTIGEYKYIEIAEDKIAVSEDEVTWNLNAEVLNRYEAVEITDRKSAKSDIVVVDYVGLIDGEEFENGSATDQSIAIGGNMYIPGFEEGLIDHEAGDKIELNLTFPEPYINNSELAGKKVVFKVAIKKVTGAREVTDDLIKEMTGGRYETEVEYRKFVKEDMVLKRKQVYVLKAVTEMVTFTKEPVNRIKNFFDAEMANYYKAAEVNNVSVDTYVKYYYNMDVESFEKKIMDYSKMYIEEVLMIEAVADKEKIIISDEEYKIDGEKLAINYGYDDLADLEKVVEKDDIIYKLLSDKVIEKLIEYSVTKEELN